MSADKKSCDMDVAKAKKLQNSYYFVDTVGKDMHIEN